MAIELVQMLPRDGMSLKAVQSAVADPSGDLCPHCGGTGDMWVVSDYAGEGAVDVLCDCSFCGGLGVWPRGGSEEGAR